MRTIIKVTGFICVTVMLGIISCTDEPENGELSVAAKQYLSMRMGSNSAMSQSMSGPVNQTFQNLFNRAGNVNGRVADDSTGVPSDSTNVPPDTTIFQDPWQSCAVITEIDNEDGSHTTIYDYGDGCEEGWEGYKYFMQGKLTSTYLNQFFQTDSIYKNTYFYSSDYDNYGGSYNDGQWSWLMNGGGTYEGESEYDALTSKFSGSYSYEDETTYQYDSIVYFYKGNGNAYYNNRKYVVESSDYEYASGDDYYKAKVLSPLVVDYSCYQETAANICFFWMYVKGRERIEYKMDDEKGSFEIDYGDGECDSIITIYEDGKKTVVDLSKNWNW